MGHCCLLLIYRSGSSSSLACHHLRCMHLRRSLSAAQLSVGRCEAPKGAMETIRRFSRPDPFGRSNRPVSPGKRRPRFTRGAACGPSVVARKRNRGERRQGARGCHGRNPPRPGEVAGGDGSSALRIDVMINNAGLMPRAPLERLKVDEWDHMIDEVCSEACA